MSPRHEDQSHAGPHRELLRRVARRLEEQNREDPRYLDCRHVVPRRVGQRDGGRSGGPHCFADEELGHHPLIQTQR
ncbi:MAG: hypothetical protein KDA83_20380, partial [Planctomycetales bacterium]|nr:hypothetical protein [Planctomycetales bacterium]